MSNFLMGLAAKFFMSNKDQIFSFALAQIGKMYVANRGNFLTLLNSAIVDSHFADNATPKDLDAFLTAIETWFKTPQFAAVEAAGLACFKK